MLHFFGVSCFILYVASSCGFFLSVFAKREGGAEWAIKLLFLGFVLHSVVLALLLIGETPFLLLDWGDYLLWLSWLLLLTYLLFRTRLDSPLVGLFVLPTTSVVFACSSWFLHYKPEPQVERTDHLLLLLHIFPALIAELALAVAFIVSLIFLLQHRRLKHKSLEALRVRGPSLELLESLNRYAALVGFFAMTVAVFSGFVRSLTTDSFVLSHDFVTWLSLITWVLLLLIVCFRAKAKWSARKLSLFTAWLAGLFFVFVVISFVVGKNALQVGVHS